MIFRYLVLFALLLPVLALAKGLDHLVFEPPANIAKGKSVVLISGDEEYRSEESLPMLAKILSQRHGFKTTVLFAIDKQSGVINPNENSNIVRLDLLKNADLMILATRWRVLPPQQLQHFLDYFNAAKPIIALRTATHAFNNTDHYGGYDWQNFGVNVVGENWLNHHGEHKVQGGRGVIVEKNAQHPLLNNVSDIFTWSDIYGIKHLDQAKATVLLNGAVTESLEMDSKIIDGKLNNPMMPLAWLKSYTTPTGDKTGPVFATTAGAAVDFKKEDLRRLVVNATYHLLNLKVPQKADVAFVDTFEPSFYGFQEADYYQKRGLKVEDFVLGKSGKAILTKAELANLNVSSAITLNKGDHIALIGNGLPERILHYGHFETELLLRNPDKDLTIRTLARPGYTPGFRPHSSRNSQWAFPGAAQFNPQFNHHSGEGHHPTSDEWLYDIAPDVIVAFFGFNESFAGKEGAENYRAELSAFVDHTLAKQYNGKNAAKLVLVSPIAFQDLSATLDLPDGKQTNKNLALYRDIMQQVAALKGLHFVDIFEPTAKMFANSKQQLTVNGAHLNQAGYRVLAPVLADGIFGQQKRVAQAKHDEVHKLVLDKNWYWFQTYQMPNGVHVDGRRFEPYGVNNYPEEGKKVKQLTQNRDKALWALLSGNTFDLVAADQQTQQLTPIKSNVAAETVGEYLYGDDALAKFEMAKGYKIELFASEVEFPNLANPAQISFDNQGRLWVSTLGSYPHYRPGDARPDDKILIYEDSDGDGKADKETVFASGLHLPIGFEITEFGVYVSQAPNLVLLKDTDGDDKADTYDIILSGFDTHDTHHAISAFTADPFGNIIMDEGVFLHSNVETAYGPVRAVNGGFYRFEPRTQKLERMVQTHIPNPWGVTYDKWGQDFFLHTSGPEVNWMAPVEMKTRYGQLTVGTDTLIEEAHRVRPTSGIEFISSRHFPDEVQGDLLLNNVIGFLGAKQHQLEDAGTGYVSHWRHDLYTSSDPNFRPVDMEFAQDGSLYVVDWHNELIGHMQHNARDPLRDHAHGRIYRVTYPERALLPKVKITGASPAELFELLKRPEDRIRYRAKRELRALPADKLIAAKKKWLKSLDNKSTDYERYVLEAMWASNSTNAFDQSLVRQLLKSKDFHVRAAAVRALRYQLADFEDAIPLLKKAANDEEGRVRLEVIAAASWLDSAATINILQEVGKHPIDSWMRNAFLQTMNNVGGTWEFKEEVVANEATHLPEVLQQTYFKGKDIYRKEGYCSTCHQVDGFGLPAAQFPPLAGTDWVTGNPERLIDIALYGIMGKVWVKNVEYVGHVPMTPFQGLLNDEEMAAVLTYVRNAFGNKASVISPEQVKNVRDGGQEPQGFWTAEALKKKYPDAEY